MLCWGGRGLRLSSILVLVVILSGNKVRDVGMSGCRDVGMSGCRMSGCRDVGMSGCRMSDVGCRMSDVGCRMSDVGCRMSDVGCRVSDVGCRMSDVGCRMSDVGCRNLATLAKSGSRMNKMRSIFSSEFSDTAKEHTPTRRHADTPTPRHPDTPTPRHPDTQIHLPIQKLEKILPNKSSVVISPVISPNSRSAWRISIATKS